MKEKSNHSKAWSESTSYNVYKRSSTNKQQQPNRDGPNHMNISSFNIINGECNAQPCRLFDRHQEQITKDYLPTFIRDLNAYMQANSINYQLNCPQQQQQQPQQPQQQQPSLPQQIPIHPIDNSSLPASPSSSPASTPSSSISNGELGGLDIMHDDELLDNLDFMEVWRENSLKTLRKQLTKKKDCSIGNNNQLSDLLFDLLSFYTDSNISKVNMRRIVDLFNKYSAIGKKIPTLDTLISRIHNVNNEYEKVFYCSKHLTIIKGETLKACSCEQCSVEGVLNKENIQHFWTKSIASCISNMVDRVGLRRFQSHLSAATDTNIPTVGQKHFIKDCVDGVEYKRITDKWVIRDDPNTICLTISAGTDGGSVNKSNSKSINPLFFWINEIGLKHRFSYPLTSLAAYANHKIPYQILLSKFIDELNELDKGLTIVTKGGCKFFLKVSPRNGGYVHHPHPPSTVKHSAADGMNASPNKGEKKTFSETMSDNSSQPNTSAVEPLWLYGYAYFSLDKTIWGLLLDLEKKFDAGQIDKIQSLPSPSSSLNSGTFTFQPPKPSVRIKQLKPTNIELLNQSFMDYSNANFKECLKNIQILIERKISMFTDTTEDRYELNLSLSLFSIIILNYSTVLSTQYQSFHNSMELLKVGEMMLKHFKSDQLKDYFTSLFSSAMCNYYKKRKKYNMMYKYSKQAYEMYSQTGTSIYAQYILQTYATSCLFRKKYEEAIECFENNIFLYKNQIPSTSVQTSLLDYFNRILTFICDNEYFIIINKCFNTFNYGVALFETKQMVPSRYYLFQAIDIMNHHLSSHHDIIIEKRWLKSMIKVYRIVTSICENQPYNDCNISMHAIFNKGKPMVDPLEPAFKNERYYITTLNKAIHYVILENERQEVMARAEIDAEEYRRVKKLVSILPLLKVDPYFGKIMSIEKSVKEKKQTIPQAMSFAKKALKSSKIFLTPLKRPEETTLDENYWIYFHSIINGGSFYDEWISYMLQYINNGPCSSVFIFIWTCEGISTIIRKERFKRFDNHCDCIRFNRI
ncbi:predicted protein [Naegleria gruberi]|uniref:Predicted protein n=1 Tax=Naegleria gruberi TaxID=5762 RepID=D2VZS9_NAEGR|nr:uncharacterized protein NAEGRDRAFT_53584 [Naegleria gruberi]EFC37711.1 predicted protein [Naegleria gruberi]|eukprot:XP_002670455.1 predicted protein [Naegleria gruberi strain NEG-M]